MEPFPYKSSFPYFSYFIDRQGKLGRVPHNRYPPECLSPNGEWITYSGDTGEVVGSNNSFRLVMRLAGGELSDFVWYR